MNRVHSDRHLGNMHSRKTKKIFGNCESTFLEFGIIKLDFSCLFLE